ncbi:MAG TPA: 50S ribosomal protein L23 [Patescibacteria group bacterium]|nr:50S ribosomal protein L23 [Patescibacteria group bacterium]
MHNTLIQPVITEKSMADAQKGKFTFLVKMQSTKDSVKKAVEKFFGVNVVSVSTIIIKGKSKRTGPKRIELISNPIKKAIVVLKEGQKIEAFELGA